MRDHREVTLLIKNKNNYWFELSYLVPTYPITTPCQRNDILPRPRQQRLSHVPVHTVEPEGALLPARPARLLPDKWAEADGAGQGEGRLRQAARHPIHRHPAGKINKV